MAMRYLNHAGTSHPKAPEVIAAVSAALSADPRVWPALYDEATSVIEGEFSAWGEFQFRLTTGCTAALSLAIRDLAWSSGQTIVTSSLEHHAVDRQAQALESERGVVRRTLSYAPDGGVNLDELRQALAREEVRLVALTHASNITGDVLPLREIAALTREAGALLLVDAAQTFGTDLFDEAVDTADLIVAAGHKWAGGPQGVGLLAARSGLRFSCPSAACEIGEQTNSTFPSFCDVGSVNLAGALGLATALRLSASTRDEAGRDMRALANRLRTELRSRSGVRVLGGTDETLRTPVVSFLMDHVPLEEAQHHFRKSGLLVRAGTHCAPLALSALDAVAGCIRVSFGAESTMNDVERVLEACDGA